MLYVISILIILGWAYLVMMIYTHQNFQILSPEFKYIWTTDVNSGACILSVLKSCQQRRQQHWHTFLKSQASIYEKQVKSHAYKEKYITRVAFNSYLDVNQLPYKTL